MPIMSTGQRKRLTIRTVFPESELMTIPFAFVSIAIAQVACDMASVLSFILYSVVLKRFAQSIFFSVYNAISAMFLTAATGYFPEADSPESIIADEPSQTAFATSEISALVGRGFCIIDSSISVAVMTLFPRSLHFLIRYFWMAGTSTNGISTPKSPLATMIPSAISQSSSMFSTPERFSILAIISISEPPFSFKKFLRSSKSCFVETKDAATKSTSFLIPKSKSFLSCSLR